MKKLWPVLGALLLLGGAGILARQMAEAGGMEQPELKQSAAPFLRFEQWLNPASGERVSLRFDGQKTTLERGGKTAAVKAQPFDEAAARAQMQDAQDFHTRWDVMNALSWRERWLSGRFKSLAEAKAGFVAAGFPAKLWDDMDAFSRAIGRPVPGDKDAGAYSGAMSIGGDGKVTVYKGSDNTETTFYLSGPEWKNNLLVNPTPEIQARYAALNTFPDAIITPPTPQAQAESALWEQSTQLARAGFIRLSPRRPDGSLWLPPALEKYRNDVLKLERPVVRPFVRAGKPAPWDSKFGGIPYRPKGAAWPRQHSGKPLQFLAQIDLGVANKDGALPDLPRHGLLQFFLGYSEGNAAPSNSTQVIYWPEIIRDATALTREQPIFSTDESERAMFNPPEHAMGFVQDSEIPSTLDAALADIRQKVSDDSIQYHQPNGHRLRGYPMVINAYFDPTEDWRLLFQFDGDDYGGQLYGENGGMGGWLGFFVRGSDLKKLDFGRVRLEMDAF